ncbi:tetratricopeptide repeat protein [Moorena sp. SIO2C4]|uniref:tetratricopeptide repeat protein n=1 Tax=Moorena sp. SIO2C4 TaxID=2607824 RepID=UPI0013CCD595|nr:tetratricopeptide repeat protein [Moorena sp. SIO2C4]NES41301.1 tetratricopeptide repeat protein [Moorena sp. SIO2C4]
MHNKPMILKKTLTGVVFGLACLGLLAGPDLASDQRHSRSLNFIYDIEGDVKIKRSEWNDYHNANVGDLVNPSDQLLLGTGASAKVRCSNLSVWHLQGDSANRVSDGCPSVILTNPRPNSPRVAPRAPKQIIPYIITPRHTALLNHRPIFRWHPVPGATSYQVSVQDASLTLDWRTKTSNTEIEYPGEPPLQPDSYYLVTVKTDKGYSSDQEQGVDLSFTLLDAQNAESVATAVAQVKQQQLTQEVETLTLAYLYHSYDLKAEAIELLEGLVTGGSQTAAVYQLLGDLYQEVGLSQEGKRPYLQALELAKGTKNLEGQAHAQVGLGQLENNKTEAIEWLNQAQKNYQKLGYITKVQEVKQWINKFQ